MSLLSSGLRNSELCKLAVSDTSIGVNRSVFMVNGTPPEKRTVYVPDSVSRMVERYVVGTRRRFLPTGVDPDDAAQPLLMSERRRPFDRTSLYRRVVRILAAAGLGERANVQLLRHTYGFLAYLRTGGNLLFVQRQLGHAHPATTSMYAELVEESYADLAERVLPDDWKAASSETRVSDRHPPRFDCEID